MVFLWRYWNRFYMAIWEISYQEVRDSRSGEDGLADRICMSHKKKDDFFRPSRQGLSDASRKEVSESPENPMWNIRQCIPLGESYIIFINLFKKSLLRHWDICSTHTLQTEGMDSEKWWNESSQTRASPQFKGGLPLWTSHKATLPHQHTLW